jgi:Ras-related protein Rab-18
MKKVSVHGATYRLNLLDTAGQERFRTLSNSYYRGAHGVILVYDISNRDSFLAMERWFEEVETNAMPGVVCYLVGTKMDKGKQRTVKFEEGEALACRFGCGVDGEGGFCEVSSKTKENVRKPFIEIVDAISKKPELLNSGRRGTGTVNVGGESVMGTGCSC